MDDLTRAIVEAHRMYRDGNRTMARRLYRSIAKLSKPQDKPNVK